MGFKADTSFLRFLSMGAVGVHRTMRRFRDRGFEPIELERYCGSNKIWTTKVKRLRLPDLLCVKTGMRVEVRAKTDLKIRMSDAPANPDRVWDVGLRDDDIVALITCFDTTDGPEPADDAVYFTVGALRASVDNSRLGPPKSASEGAERDRTWPAIVPSRNGTVLEVSDERLIVQMNASSDRPPRRQTYRLRGKSVYVAPGDTFRAQSTILAGEPPTVADLSAFLPRRYAPLDDLQADNDVDRYAAVKALRFREDPRNQVVTALEDLIRREPEARVALEAAGSAAALWKRQAPPPLSAPNSDKNRSPISSGTMMTGPSCAWKLYSSSPSLATIPLPANSSTALSLILVSKEMNCGKLLSGHSAKPGSNATKMSSHSSTMLTKTLLCTLSAHLAPTRPGG